MNKKRYFHLDCQFARVKKKRYICTKNKISYEFYESKDNVRIENRKYVKDELSNKIIPKKMYKTGEEYYKAKQAYENSFKKVCGKFQNRI